MRLRHRILGRRYRRLVIEHVDGVHLVVLPDVFNPVLFRTGVFLARSMLNVARPRSTLGGALPRALDMGTGSGIGAIFSARLGYRVIGVDLNPEAVRCARMNALLNNLEDRIEFRHGDLFAPVAAERFDLVLFNPPFHHGTPADALDQAWRGDDVIERFSAGLGSALEPGGEALIVLSTDGDWERTLSVIARNGIKPRPVATRDFGNETLTVYALTVGDSGDQTASR